MNIYDYAMQMEKDGERYYRDLAINNPSKGLARIFTMLADEEVKHFNVVQMLSVTPAAAHWAESDILDNVKNVFVDMQVSDPGPYFVDTTEATQSFRKARDIEKVSRDFYQEKAAQTPDEHGRRIFLQLAREEEKHLWIVLNILEFVSRPEPGNWLENAEWHHLTEY